MSGTVQRLCLRFEKREECRVAGWEEGNKQTRKGEKK
jgi:hypothetical protein